MHGAMSLKFNVSLFLEYIYIKISLNSGNNKGHFTWRPMSIYHISLSSFENEKCFRRNFVEKIKGLFILSKTFFFFENHTVWQIMWENTVEQDRPLMTTRRMRIACWIPKAISTHSKHAILITFSLHLNVTFIRTLPVLFYVIPCEHFC